MIKNRLGNFNINSKLIEFENGDITLLDNEDISIRITKDINKKDKELIGVQISQNYIDISNSDSLVKLDVRYKNKRLGRDILINMYLDPISFKNEKSFNKELNTKIIKILHDYNIDYNLSFKSIIKDIYKKVKDNYLLINNKFTNKDINSLKEKYIKESKMIEQLNNIRLFDGNYVFKKDNLELKCFLFNKNNNDLNDKEIDGNTFSLYINGFKKSSVLTDDGSLGIDLYKDGNGNNFTMKEFNFLKIHNEYKLKTLRPYFKENFKHISISDNGKAFKYNEFISNNSEDVIELVNETIKMNDYLNDYDAKIGRIKFIDKLSNFINDFKELEDVLSKEELIEMKERKIYNFIYNKITGDIKLANKKNIKNFGENERIINFDKGNLLGNNIAKKNKKIKIINDLIMLSDVSLKAFNYLSPKDLFKLYFIYDFDKLKENISIYIKNNGKLLKIHPTKLLKNSIYFLDEETLEEKSTPLWNIKSIGKLNFN